MEYGESNTCSNGIIYIPNGDGTYREIGITDTWENLEDIYTGESYSSEEWMMLHPNDEFSFTATITNSMGFEEWYEELLELWNRQCAQDILLAAELYDIDGVSQDGYRKIEPINKSSGKSSEAKIGDESPDSIFDNGEESRELTELIRAEIRIFKAYFYYVLMAPQLYDIDGRMCK